MSDLGKIYEALSTSQEIFVMPVRMREERLRLLSDDSDHVVIVVDYFLEDSPLMLFAPKQIMEAWFFGAGAQPRKNLPMEVHVPGDLISENGGILILKMRFIGEHDFAKMISEIQNGHITIYRTE
jgi:hypothetical protein